MDLRAYWGTAIVHTAALAMAVLPAEQMPGWLCCSFGAVAHEEGGSGTGTGPRPSSGGAPSFFIVSNRQPKMLFDDLVLRAATLDADELQCPQNGPVSRDAVADLLWAQDDRPFDWLGPDHDGHGPGGGNPAICVRIERNGLVSEAFVAKSSGDAGQDRALLRTARSLLFAPAQRAGQAIPAWHRLIVNRRLDGELPAPTAGDPPVTPPFHEK